MAKAWVKFYPEAGERVKRGMIGNLADAGKFLRDQVKKSIAVHGNGIPSRPGKPPHYQTGRLWRSVRWERKNVYGVSVIANAPYGIFLEYGTSKMAARPYLRPAIWNNRAVIRKILGTKKGIDIKRQNV